MQSGKIKNTFARIAFSNAASDLSTPMWYIYLYATHHLTCYVDFLASNDDNVRIPQGHYMVSSISDIRNGGRPPALTTNAGFNAWSWHLSLASNQRFCRASTE